MVFAFVSCNNSAKNEETDKVDETPQYDSTLAKQLGANKNGMKIYTLVVLEAGDYMPSEQEEIDSLFHGHAVNIDKLTAEGKMVIAGPFAPNDKNYKGLFIFDSMNKKDVEKMLENDPAIAAGIFKPVLYHWLGSAALPVYLETHAKIEKPD
jgi:uncharacterized protein YciI